MWGFLSIGLVVLIFAHLNSVLVPHTEMTVLDFFSSFIVAMTTTYGSYGLYNQAAVYVRGKFKPHERFYFGETWIDLALEFDATWVWVYSFAYYFVMVMCLVLSPSTTIFFRRVFQGLVTKLILVAIWRNCPPTTIPPQYIDLKETSKQVTSKSWSLMFLLAVQGVDGQSVNSIPSGHCALMVVAISQLMSNLGLPICVITHILLMVSCLKTKQHVFLDTVLGTMLGLGISLGFIVLEGILG